MRLRAALLSENPLEDGHFSDRFRLTEFYRVKFRNVVELWLRPPLAVIGLFRFYLRLGLKIISGLEIQVLVSLMTNLHFLQWRQDVSYLGCWTICLHVGGVCYRFLSPQSCNYLKTLKQNPKIGEWGGVGGGRRGQLSHINQINFVEICSFSNKTNWLLTYSTWFLSDVQMSLSSVLAPFGFIYSLIFCRLFFTVL